ncbi:ribulokinase [Cytobacillus firmus]|uniref:Ribulokinase n=1 Tax=Cytobacillus firmus TaxID=1399 RepID=A0A800MTI6_CYTFI|nr:ribulokinase [Cytobacillus firmus]KAF0822212.1 Ribulokinase [Cytobacillus firmus]
MDNKYVFGVDFGTESARAILVNVQNGTIVTSSVSRYPHGVITERLPGTEIKLNAQWALQHPNDYLHTLRETVIECLRVSEIKREDVIGIGVDFTASTIMPINESGIPLCLCPEYKDNPHSWVKLWKHHAADEEATLINSRGTERNESFLNRYGGELSEEWMFPKMLQVLNEAPEVYEAADRFIEAGDWITMQLIGSDKRSSCMAGYKGSWSKKEGYPSNEFLKTLHPDFEQVVQEKLTSDIYPVGSRAGFLTEKMAAELGLTEKTAVAVGIIDAHAAVLGAGVDSPQKMVMAMGTSICHMCIDKEERFVPGISGVVEDGILPGYYAYEAGQSAGGDSLAWFINHCIPDSLAKEAESAGISLYQLMEEKASRLMPGEHGLVALDWWNGNRLLKDPNLTGTIVGLTLGTKPEHIYRALLESLAFGARKILQTFGESGISIEDLYACGGLAEKNKLLMQLFADITGRNVHVVTVPNTCAMGAAVLGAVAAGKERGGWDSISEAINEMLHYDSELYKPNAEYRNIYNQLFEVYEQLHQAFSQENSPVKTLIDIQKNLDAKKEAVKK